MSDAVLACPLSWTSSPLDHALDQKSAPTHTISFVGLASSHDLVETVASRLIFAVYAKKVVPWTYNLVLA